MPVCDQCGRKALYQVEGHNLCLFCWNTVQQAHINMLNQLNAMQNYHMDLMADMVGLPRMGPYVETPQPTYIQQANTNLNTTNNIRVESGSQVGVISAGALSYVDKAVTVFNKSGNQDLAKELREFAQAVVDSTEVAVETQRKILESLQFIISESAKQKSQRNTSVLGTVLDNLRSMLGTVERLGMMWEKLKPLLEGLLA